MKYPFLNYDAGSASIGIRVAIRTNAQVSINYFVHS